MECLCPKSYRGKNMQLRLHEGGGSRGMSCSKLGPAQQSSDIEKAGAVGGRKSAVEGWI